MSERWVALLDHWQGGVHITPGEIVENPLPASESELFKGRTRTASRQLVLRPFACEQAGCEGRIFVDQRALALHQQTCHASRPAPASKPAEPRTAEEHAERIVRALIRDRLAESRRPESATLVPSRRALMLALAWVRTCDEARMARDEAGWRRRSAEEEGDGPRATVQSFVEASLAVHVKRLAAQNPVATWPLAALAEQAEEPATEQMTRAAAV